MLIFQNPEYIPKNIEEKNWIYDLIQSDNEMIFVAEVRGPEKQIDIKLVGDILHIKGAHNFARNISLKSTSNMTISDSRYRNGVLTLRIQML